MVPWGTIAGIAAYVAFPQHRGVIVIVGAVSSLLQKNKESEPEFGPRELSYAERKALGDRPEAVTLEWRGIKCKLHDKKSKETRLLLDSISGVALPGRLLAIMGPSGSGKTTLLNTLAHQLPKSGKLSLHGSILVNGVPENKSSYRIAYVRQEDVFFSQMTVRETLTFAAMLQLPTDMAVEEKKGLVEDLMQLLGLLPVADSIVGDAKTRGISGGEKKRLSIACEMIGSPSVIFADEPTTGLDAFQAQQVMAALHSLAEKGHTVVCSIHQPRSSIYSLFDDILLLAKGQPVYAGLGGKEPLAHFQAQGHVCPTHCNPAEFLSDLVGIDHTSPETEAESKKRIASLVSHFQSKFLPPGHKEGGEKAAEQESVEGSSVAVVSSKKSGGERLGASLRRLLTHFKILFSRAWKQTTRDKSTNFVRAAMNISSALIFGSVFWRMGLTQTAIQDRMGLLQVTAINTAMASLTKTVNVFPKERLIVSRERAKGAYSVGPYFLSKLLAELPIGALFPALFGLVVYPMAGLNKSLSSFARFLGILTLESFTSSALGLTVGCLVPTSEAAMALGPSVMTLFIVFGGYYINEENTPALFRWIPNVSLIRWGFEGLCINEFTGLQFKTTQPTDLSSGEQVLARLSFDSASIGDTLQKQAKILAFWYWASAFLLTKKKPRFQQIQDTDSEDEGKTRGKVEVVEDSLVSYGVEKLATGVKV